MTGVPFDLDAVLPRLDAAFRDQAKLAVPLFDQLRRSVERLDRHAGDLERSSRGYPVLRFFADGLTVSVTPAQRGVIRLQGAIVGVGQALTAGLEDFAAGLRWIGTAVTQEKAIPRLLDVAQGMVTSAAASLARFPDPHSLYEPGATTASDLVGEIGVIFRTLVLPAGIRAPITGAREVSEAIDFLGLRPAPAAGPGAASDPMAPARALEAVSWELFGVMLALPVVPALPALTRAELTLMQARFLAEVRRAEAATAPLRDGVAMVMRSTYTIGQAAVAFHDRYASFVEGAVATMADFAADYASSVLGGTRGWASAVSEEIGSWVRIAEIIRSVLATVFSTDLMPLLAAAAGIPLPPGLLPPLTLDDLASAGIEVGLAQARLAVDAATLALSPYLPADRVAALREAATIMLTPTPVPVKTSLPPAAPPFPDISAAFLDRREKAEFGAALTRLGHQVPRQVGEILDAGAGASAELAVRFHRAARQAATAPASTLADLAGQARRRAAAVTAGTAGAPSIPAGLAEAGQAFERELARGGIMLAAAAIPVYAARLRRLWRQGMAGPPGPDEADPAKRRRSGPHSERQHPISPHHLAARARVTTVATPRIVLRLPVTELDDGLIWAVVEAFGQGAVEAWQAGVRDQAAQAAGARHGP